jgi:hypothetical protein
MAATSASGRRARHLVGGLDYIFLGIQPMKAVALLDYQMLAVQVVILKFVRPEVELKIDWKLVKVLTIS